MLGDFGLVLDPNGAGRWIELAEALDHKGPSLFTHAFVVVGEGRNPEIVSAMPHGARIQHFLDYSNVTLSSWVLSPEQRAAISVRARLLVGTPYSFIDYLSLALLHFHVRPSFVVNYVASTHHMICSQFVDEVYAACGVHLFTDNRFPGDVTPADLGDVLHGPVSR